MKTTPTAFAIAAHPDDIEFMMAGTLLLLKEQGFELHYMTLSSGNCGSMVTGPAETRRIRRKESEEAARILGAHFHHSLCDDLEVLYEVKTLRRLAAIVRDVAPKIILTHSPHDYMEDHMNTSRLAVTAAFARGMPNFRTSPARPPAAGPVVVYHAMPHGLRDGLRQPVQPDFFVNTSSVHEIKRQALAAHRSQKDWLDATQGMGSYIDAMDQMSAEVGRMSGKFAHAEGWRRHLHLGFSASEIDPVSELLDCIIAPTRTSV